MTIKIYKTMRSLQCWQRQKGGPNCKRGAISFYTVHEAGIVFAFDIIHMSVCIV
jgi:hypothetical protein